MSWIIVRQGFYRYLQSKNPCVAFSEDQKDAIRFQTKDEAVEAMGWNACLHSSWPCRIVKLSPPSSNPEDAKR